MIKKILLIAICFSFAIGSMDSFAKKNNYFTNYDQALQSSKETNKPLMLVVVTNTCPWCEKLEKQTLSKEIISSFISKHFTPVILNRDKAQYPINKFVAKVVPTVFFIDPKDEEIIHNSYGYKTKEKFLYIIEKISENYKDKS
jgi:thioredoxin-related protein